ncbi:HIRAN domain-containing protein [Micromonospora avicenniae]|uniref:Collagen, type III, alpha n=1 Tax=Micromonospora avicenniae TaxID=1198245 RepID=A0A1N6W0B7_9ACTN|nr:HIRAN domain-containing protein [Micromonospora avicenniae]SIQ83569.1 collagen, type III, alpha [Micromonospora avicenniae]
MSIPFDLWGQRGWASVEVAGESHYATHIRELFGKDLKPSGSEIVVTAQLVPDPQNRHDRNAVGVWVGNKQLGHLPRDEAARYVPVLASLTAQGWLPQVSARVWGTEWSDYEERRASFRGSVRLDLAEPHMLVPVNLPPSGQHRLLPTGAAIQVTGEEKHLDALAPLLRPEGECWAYVSLHEMVEQTARTSRTVVEVRVDGSRVGQLTPKMSGELLPAIRHLAQGDVTTTARAIIKGNRIKSEVVLYVARAHELPDTWLGPAAPAAPAQMQAHAPDFVPQVSPTSAVRPHGPIPPAPSGIRFVVPANWPQPPAGWAPPPGWRPDPSWPAAPEGWQWWIPVWE